MIKEKSWRYFGISDHFSFEWTWLVAKLYNIAIETTEKGTYLGATEPKRDRNIYNAKFTIFFEVKIYF